MVGPVIDRFGPTWLIISAGFDGHEADPLAQMNLSSDMFAWMTTRLMEQADRHAGGRIVSILEGGYNVDELARCVATHVGVLAGAQPTGP